MPIENVWSHIINDILERSLPPENHVNVSHCIVFCGSSGQFEPWWRHQMVTFSTLLAICAGNSPVPVNSPHKSQWRGALMFSLICVWITGWVNKREAGDLRRYRAHYDVTVMLQDYVTGSRAIVLFFQCQWSYLESMHGYVTRMDSLTRHGLSTAYDDIDLGQHWLA